MARFNTITSRTVSAPRLCCRVSTNLEPVPRPVLIALGRLPVHHLILPSPTPGTGVLCRFRDGDAGVILTEEQFKDASVCTFTHS